MNVELVTRELNAGSCLSCFLTSPIREEKFKVQIVAGARLCIPSSEPLPCIDRKCYRTFVGGPVQLHVELRFEVLLKTRWHSHYS